MTSREERLEDTLRLVRRVITVDFEVIVKIRRIAGHEITAAELRNYAAILTRIDEALAP